MTGKRIGGYRRRTRDKLSKSPREKGKISLTRYFQIYKIGDKVKLNLESSITKGKFCPRYNGKVGVVVGSEGECYKVKIRDIHKEKVILVHPIHIRKEL
jgi:large subunit ribosomal protein L21e